MRAALGLDEPPFGPAPAIEQGKSPDTFLILAHGPLPLRLCAFAPLRLCVPFFQQPGSLREIHCPNSLTRGLPPHPPRPLLPQPKPWGRGGAKRSWGERIRIVFRRVGEAGFAAQPTIERGIGF